MKKIIIIAVIIVLLGGGVAGAAVYRNYSKQKQAQAISDQIQDYYNTPAAKQTIQHIAEANKAPALKKSPPGSICNKMGFTYQVESQGAISCTHGAD